MAAIAPV